MNFCAVATPSCAGKTSASSQPLPTTAGNTGAAGADYTGFEAALERIENALAGV